MSEDNINSFINLENLRESNARGFVYEITCECGAKYIGETEQPLQERVRHHFYAAKNPSAPSYGHLAFAKHSKKCHEGNPLDIHISGLVREENKEKRMELEKKLVEERDPELNTRLKKSSSSDLEASFSKLTVSDDKKKKK